MNPATTVTGPDTFGDPAVVGTSLLYAREDHDHGLPAAPIAGPTANGYAAWTADPAITTTTLGTGSPFAKGTVNYYEFYVPTDCTITDIDVFETAGPTGGTLANTYLGIYDQAGNQLAISADVSALFTGTNSVISVPISSVNLAGGTTYVVAILFGNSSSASGLPGIAVLGSTTIHAASLPNANITPAANTLNLRAGAFGSGLDALPSPFVGTPVIQTYVLWAGFR